MTSSAFSLSRVGNTVRNFFQADAMCEHVATCTHLAPLRILLEASFDLPVFAEAVNGVEEETLGAFTAPILLVELKTAASRWWLGSVETLSLGEAVVWMTNEVLCSHSAQE